MTGGGVSPNDDAVDELLLFLGGAAEVEAGGGEVSVAEEVGEEGEVVVAVQEVLGVEVPEGVGMDRMGVHAVLDGVVTKLRGDSAGGDAAAVLVHEQVAAVPVDPVQCLGPERAGDVQPTVFPSFGIDVEEPLPDVLHFHLDEFAHPGAGRRHVPHGKIPLEVRLLFQSFDEEGVILVADDVVAEGKDGHSRGLELPLGLAGVLQKLVDALDPQVHGLRPERSDEV